MHMNRSLVLIALLSTLVAQVTLTKSPAKVAVEIDGKPFTEFFYGEENGKPYLHPLRAASGKIVTRQHPMADVAGEQHDHPHHRGLWFSHGAVNEWDFWANEPSQKGIGKGRGTIVVRDVALHDSGKKTASMLVKADWLDGTGKKLLEETRRMTFYSLPDARQVDFDITLKAAEKVAFGDTKEGTFAIRLAHPLIEKGQSGGQAGKMTSSTGTMGMKAIWGQPAPWVDYAGTIDGEALGVAILDHPGNPRHPARWHARDYGLFAANIFGLHDFMSDKSKDGSMTLAPGESTRFRYRVVIHPGLTADSNVQAMFVKYVGAPTK